jgi:hypothetical protein
LPELCCRRLAQLFNRAKESSRNLKTGRVAIRYSSIATCLGGDPHLDETYRGLEKRKWTVQGLYREFGVA